MASYQLSLTEEQRAAVKAPGDACVVACPGSGKTRVLISRLLKELDSVRGTARRVACITYTNAAVYEILRRVRRLQMSGEEWLYEVGTIHSFCLRNILRRYQHLSPVADWDLKILAVESDWFRETASQLCKTYGVEAWSRDSIYNVHPLPDGTLNIPPGVPIECAGDFRKRLRDEQYITFGDIVHLSFKIVVEHGYVPRALAALYSVFLIDEFQDTSAAQVEILQAIAQHRMSHFFYVGDINQSIMGFAGARPDLVGSFSNRIGLDRRLSLSGNFRSSSRIVTAAEKLLPSSMPMQAVGSDRDFSAEVSLFHVDSALDGIVSIFLPALRTLDIGLGASAVLAPQWFPLYHLARGLRLHDIPIFGPGSRPYSRSLLFARVAEEVCAFSAERSARNFQSLQLAFESLILDITGTWLPALRGYSSRVLLLRAVEISDRVRRETQMAIEWLPRVASEIGALFLGADLISEQQRDILEESANAMIEAIEKNKDVQANSLVVDDLGLFASQKDALRLMTLHASKGREFDAVAIIDLHEGKIPHWKAETEPQIEESRRLLYVGVTRARKLLHLFADQSDWRNRPSRFLGSEGLALN